MTISVGSSAYKLEIKKKHARGHPWVFRKSSPTDGFTEMLTYLRTRRKDLIEYDENHVLKISRLRVNGSGRWIDGILVKGEAGAIQDLIDVETAKVTYTKQMNEAVLEPYYFRFHLEDGRPYGIALLQTWGQGGTKGALQADMSSYFEKHDPPLTSKLTQIVDSAALELFVRQGKLQDVILINRGKTQKSRSILAKNSVGGDHLGKEGDKLELRLRKNWTNRALSAVVAALRGKKRPDSVVHVGGMDTFDDLKVTLRVGSRVQMFSLLNPDDSPLKFDISEQVTYGEDGFPTFGSLRATAREVYEDSIAPILS